MATKDDGHSTSSNLLSIGIPAYNESLNLSELLHTLCSGSYEEFQLKEIIVYDDGSDDGTGQIIRDFENRDARVKGIFGTSRLGSNAGWNAIFAVASGNVIVKLDADIGLEVPDIVRLARRVGEWTLVAGRPVPRSNRITLATVASTFSAQLIAELSSLRGGEIYFIGRFFAVSRSLVEDFQIPQSIINNDLFTVLALRKRGARFAYCRDAVCYYGPPATLGGFARQNSRASAGRSQLSALGYDCGGSPRNIVNAMTRATLKRPWHIVAWIVAVSYSAIVPSHIEATSMWEIVQSTKTRFS